MDSLEEIYVEMQPKLFAYFYVKTSDLAASEDLTQDVFYEASKCIHTYRGEASLSTWIYSIAKNRLKKYYRSKKYEQSLMNKIGEIPAENNLSLEQFVEVQQELNDLVQRIHKLEQPAKEIALLRIYSDMSFKEIGDLIGKSENYARVIFHRTKIKLKREGER